MSARETGKLVYLTSPNEVEIREYDVPEADPGGIVTEVEQANVCGSELHIWKGHHPELKELILGHEVLCRISDLGEGVTTDNAGEPVSEGDLVVPTYFAACGECDYCSEGDFVLCDESLSNWLKSPDEWPHFHGTFATHYYIQPDQHFYKVPEDIDPGVAAAANCALTQVIYGMDVIGIEYDDWVVIQGGGGLGLQAIAVAAERGANTILVEGVDSRISLGERFGADHVVDFREYDTVESRAERIQELTDWDGADVAIEVAGTPQAFAEGIHLLRKGGRYLEIGNITPGRTADVDPGLITRKSLNIEGTVKYQPWYLKKALEFLVKNGEKYPFEDLIDTEYRLEDVQEALEESDDRNVTRATLLPQ